eukprot:gene3959-biopygen5074
MMGFHVQEIPHWAERGGNESMRSKQEPMPSETKFSLIMSSTSQKKKKKKKKKKNNNNNNNNEKKKKKKKKNETCDSRINSRKNKNQKKGK